MIEEKTFKELMDEKKKPRRISLVIEDDGGIGFKFHMEGDLERIGKIATKDYSAAEFWGVQFFGMCQDFLNQTGEVKKIPIPQGDTNASIKP